MGGRGPKGIRIRRGRRKAFPLPWLAWSGSRPRKRISPDSVVYTHSLCSLACLSLVLVVSDRGDILCCERIEAMQHAFRMLPYFGQVALCATGVA